MKRFYSLIVLAVFLCCGTTAWGAQSLPYSYGFEDYELSTDGWTKQNPSNKNNSKFVINGTSKRTGYYGFQFSSYTDNGENTQYLISPELDAANGVDVSFYYKNSNSGKAEVFKVGYSTTDTEIESFTFGDEISKSDASWEEYANSFPAGTKYIAVYYYSNYQYYLFVDDFHFEAPASCATPTDVKATQNTPVKATLSWTKAEGKDNYQYLYVAKGETPNWNSVVAQNTNSVEIDGLTSGVEYDFYVRTYCDSEDQSEAVKKTFSVTCPAPTFPTTPVTELSASGATVTWNAVDGISKYQYLCVVKDADTTGLWATVEAKEGLSAELTSLTAKTHYDFYVRSWYSATSISDAVKTTFRTDADCSAIVVDADHTWEEDFSGFEVGNENSDAPDCWALLNANAGSRPYIYISASGTSWFSLSNNALYFSNVNTKYGYAIFPAFVTALNTLQITFDQKVESASSSGAIELGYMTNITDESTFNLLLSCNKSTSWKSENVILTAVPAGARLAFRYKATSSSYYDAAVDNIVVSLAPACSKPSDVKTTALDSVSATITWTNGGEETSWKLQYSTDKTNWTAANEGNAFTTKPFVLNGLHASTTYYVQVAAVCGESDESEWSVAGEFTTDCNAVDELNEAFSSSLPDCWKVTKTGGEYSWATNSSYRVSASYSMNYYATAATTEYSDLITPNVNLGDKESNLTFYLKNDGYSGSVTAEVYIVVGKTTTKLVDLGATSGWVLQTIDLTDYVGKTAKFIFRAHGLGAYSNIYIDDVAVTVKPCATPTGLAAVKGNATAEISWTDENADKWNLRYRIVAEPENEWTTVNGQTAKPHTLESLLNGNEYEVQVQAACSATRTSDWTASVKFTPEACPTVTEVTLGAKTYNSVVVNWATSSASNCDVRYSTDNGENWTVAEENIAATTYTLSGLSIGATYTVAVKPNCGDADAWVAAAETYTPDYTAPTVGEITAITDASATFAWSAVSDATGYEYTVARKDVAADWTAKAEVLAEVTSATIDTLKAGVTYVFYVRSAYPAGTSAADSKEFTTITIAPKGLQQDGESTVNSATFKWEANGAATQYQWSLDNTNWSDPTTALTATVEDLTAGTSYTFYVRSWYNADVQSAAASQPFDTQCATETLPFEQHFNSTSKPNCWTADNWGSSANNWSIDEYTIHSAEDSYAASYNARTGTSNSADLITPKIELSDVAILEFYYQNRYTYYGYSYAISFDVVVLDASDDSALRTKSYTEASGSEVWESDTIDLSAFVGKTIKVKFHGKGVGTYYTAYLKLDDISVTVKPCATPTDLAVAASKGSAVVTWKDDEADKWNLRYKKTADAKWTTIEGLTAKSHTLESLDEEAEYEVQVQAVCSATRSSAWTDSENFTPACPTPGNIQFTNPSFNGVTVTWTAGGSETAWNLEYQKGETGWTPVLTNPLSTTSYTFTDLETDVTYSFQVQASCGGDWSEVANVTLHYSAPASASVADIADVTATASWDAVADATNGYEYIVVARDAEANWTSPTATDELTAALNGLDVAAEYDFYVRAVYGLNHGSATKAQFATITIAPKELQQDGDATTNAATFSWKANGAATQYQWSLDNSTWSDPISALTATAEGLTEGTSYTFYVRSWYNADVQSAATSLPFNTACATKSLGWSEDFNGSTSIPNCWEADAQWTVAASSGVSNTNALRFQSSASANITLPAVLLSEEAVLRFSHTNYYVSGEIYVNSVAEENKLADIAKSSSWKSEEISLAKYTGETITLIFRGLQYNSSYSMYIDNVSVIEKPCAAITSLTATAALDSVVLVWESDAEAFEYCVVPQGNEASGWQAADAKTVTVKTLTPTFKYTAYVRSSCSETKKGEAKSANFTPACPAPTALTIGEVTTKTATLSWTAAAGISQYQYRLGTEEWKNENVVEGTSVELKDLDPATEYTLYVRSWYNADAQSDAINKSFTTACGVQALPFEEDFDGAITCWTLENCHASTGVDSKAFRFYFNTNPPQYLISPELVPTEKYVKVQFQYRAQSPSYKESFQVGYSKTTKEIESDAFVWSDTTFCSETDYQDYNSETLPAGVRYVAIRYTANNQYYLFIDNFKVFEYDPTAIDLVGTGVDDKKVVKRMENGILYIIRDGIKYNAQGGRISE